MDEAGAEGKGAVWLETLAEDVVVLVAEDFSGILSRLEVEGIGSFSFRRFFSSCASRDAGDDASVLRCDLATGSGELASLLLFTPPPADSVVARGLAGSLVTGREELVVDDD